VGGQGTRGQLAASISPEPALAGAVGSHQLGEATLHARSARSRDLSPARPRSWGPRRDRRATPGRPTSRAMATAPPPRPGALCPPRAPGMLPRQGRRRSAARKRGPREARAGSSHTREAERSAVQTFPAPDRALPQREAVCGEELCGYCASPRRSRPARPGGGEPSSSPEPAPTHWITPSLSFLSCTPVSGGEDDSRSMSAPSQCRAQSPGATLGCRMCQTPAESRCRGSLL
jgi:hypothetical protein